MDERFAVPPPTLAVHVTGPVRELRAARDDRGRDVAGGGARARTAATSTSRAAAPTRASPATTTSSWSCRTTAPRARAALARGPGLGPSHRQLDQRRHRPGRARAARAASPCTWPTPPGASARSATGLGFPSGKDKTVLLDLDRPLPGRRGRAGCASPPTSRSSGTAWAGRRAGPTCASRRAASTLRLGRAALPRVLGDGAGRTPALPSVRATCSRARRPRWLDLEGYHTRFGDVRELLAGVDDRYVIMNAGDEMRLRFREAPAARGRAACATSCSWATAG